MLEVAEEFAVRFEEEVAVIDLAGALELRAERELAVQHGDCARAEHDLPIFTGLGRVLVMAIDPRLRDRERSMGNIEVIDDERNLFRRSQACEKPELIVVALRLAPIAMKRGD